MARLISSLLLRSKLLLRNPDAGGGGHADSLLLETGDYLLLETGDTLLLE